ncbi:hypothetical protein [Sphingomonas koreensis]
MSRLQVRAGERNTVIAMLGLVLSATGAIYIACDNGDIFRVTTN